MTHTSNQAPARHSAIISGTVAAVGLLIAVGALLFFAWLAEEMLEGDTMIFDNAVRGFIHDHSNETLTSTMRALTFMGSTLFLSSLTTVVLVVLFVGRHWWSSAVFAVMMAGAVVLNFVLKTAFSRDRPTTYFDTPVPNSYSFPSGHALFSFCFYASLGWIITRHLKNPWVKAAVWTMAVLLFCGVGLSRIYLGVHYPSDVIAGYTAAIIWLIAVAVADRWLSLHKDQNNLPANHAKERE